MANITKEFLETVIGQEIDSFEVNSGSNLGDGYMSLLYTVDVTLKDRGEGQEVRHILVKCYPTNQGRQELLAQGNMFEKELKVYNTLIPALVDFQKNFKNGQITFKPPFADFYYGKAVDYKNLAEGESRLCSDPLDNCIVMPDLRKTGGYRLANRLVGFDLDHCRLVILAQAKFHGLSWAYKALAGLKSLDDKFPFLAGSFLDDFDPKMIDVMFDNSQSLFLGAVENLVTDEQEKSRLVEGVKWARAKMLDMMYLYFADGTKVSDPSMTKDNALRVPGEINKNEAPWLVALHGDSWLNNMMFRYDEKSGKPIDVILIDLQLTREGDPLMDICYSIFTSTTSDFRRKHAEDLLKLYVETFTKICTHFGVSPPPGFNLTELKRRFHRGAAIGFACCLMGYPIFLNDPKDAVDFEKIGEGEEGGAKAEDMFKEMANMTQNLRGSKHFEERVVDLVRDMYAQGVI